MNSHQAHAMKAGSALSMATSATTIKPSNAKVGLGEKLRIVVTEAVANRFHGRAKVSFNTELVAGKLVVEVTPVGPDAPKARSWSPLMPGQKVLLMEPDLVEHVGPNFPKFGMCSPDAVIWGRDNVLRITLPAKRPPLSPRRTKMVGAERKPRKAAIRKDLPVATKPQEVKTEKSVKVKGISLAFSKSNVRVYLTDELVAKIGTTSYSVTDISESGEGRDHVVCVKLSHNGPYRVGRTAKNGQRTITLNGVDKFPQLYFRKTQVSAVNIEGDCETLTFEVKGTLAPPINRQRRAKIVGDPAPLGPPAATDWFSRLRAARDEINSLVAQASRENEKVELVVRADGTLGIRYEG